MGGDGAGGKTIQLQHGQLTVGLPECPQETLRVGEARTKDTALSKHLCKGGSRQSLVLFKDPNLMRLEMTRIQQTEIVRTTYFQNFPVT